MPRRPNIVFIMTDHTRSEALRNTQCLTPNLDSLAAEGVRFDRAYTTNAICSPARASLMTGTYASTHGVWDCTHTQRSEWVDVRSGLTFWPKLLQQAGYDNGYFGKWHVEQSNRLADFGWPTYDLKCASHRGKPAASPQLVARTPGYKDAIVAGVAEGDSNRHPAFDKGIEFIRSHAGGERPFCCFISSAEPHDPYIPPRQFFQMYDRKAIRLSPTLHEELQDKPEIIRRMASLWKDFTEDDWRLAATAYFALITFIDREVGRIVDALRQAGVYDETIIVFSADHGDMLGSHGLLAKGITPYEEVYNIPLIVRLPGGKVGGSNATHRVSTVDIGQTLLDLCGAGSIPNCQGRSFRPVLEGRADPADWQDAYAEFYGQRFVYTQRIVWHGDWKYVFSPGGLDELYDLGADPHEKTNLAAREAHRDRLLDMTKRMWRKMDAIGDQSLLETHYKTLRTAPIGPLAR